MRILYVSETWGWCRDRGIPDGPGGVPVIAGDDPALPHRRRVVFAPRGPVGHEPAAAAAIRAAIQPWDECLLWVTGWGAWPSSEDWPRYYALRGRHGQRLSLGDAPGHVAAADDADFRDLLLQVLCNGWDAVLVPVRGGRAADLRVHVSHDGWARVSAAAPVEFRVEGLDDE
jgi:hypothetical protein